VKARGLAMEVGVIVVGSNNVSSSSSSSGTERLDGTHKRELKKKKEGLTYLWRSGSNEGIKKEDRKPREKSTAANVLYGVRPPPAHHGGPQEGKKETENRQKGINRKQKANTKQAERTPPRQADKKTRGRGRAMTAKVGGKGHKKKRQRMPLRNA
jgi:hypothetical protein